ncbi:ATP-dependent DNA helicase RecG [Thermovenabulum sp.]|uniref:ATP-dependent DNA helicase RecG n=1 Tax=Thermovenabulum sp. TaxID=3100335 RepID=UPI003C7D4C6F
MVFLDLNLDVRYLKGVGPARAKLLKALDIKTVKDLLFFFPRDYIDLTPMKLKEAIEDQKTTFFLEVKELGQDIITRSGVVLTKIPVTDGESDANLVFFNQPYIKSNLFKNEKLIVIGKIRKNFGEYEILSPQYYKVKEDIKKINKILPVYSLTRGLTQKNLQKIIEGAFKDYYLLLKSEEILPQFITQKYGLMPKANAIYEMHFPKNWDSLKKAKDSLAFEELLIFQMGMRATKEYLLGKKRSNIYKDFNLSPFLNNLPFKLTNGQKRVLKEILQDLNSEKVMNRLLQGDVGSGKTVVAASIIYLAYKNGYQSAFMAPTEILAQQHYENLNKFLNPFGTKVEILKGNMGAKRKEILEKIKKNQISVVVGTHALLQEDVEFANLGLVITDEQHRFGVRQREELVKKGFYPDVMVMSATPIPRTLALTLYADLDISIINEMPKGRKKIATYLVNSELRHRVYKFMISEVEKGHQVYIICPAVEKNNFGLLSVEEKYDEIVKEFPDLKVGILHGKLKNAEKDKVMEDFLSKKIQVLISTTVVEVGVDVPNATLIIIENAERFGLAQLHQLRGRVGRGNLESYCILITDSREEDARERLKVLLKTSDGFEIAQKDLELRGPGEFLGEKQHGLPEFKFAGYINNLKMIEETKKLADFIYDKGLIKTKEFEKIREIVTERIRHL